MIVEMPHLFNVYIKLFDQVTLNTNGDATAKPNS